MFAKVLLIALALAVVVAVSARTSDGAGPEEQYVVRPYDTLWTIAAAHYGGDPRSAVWRIEQRNGLSGPTIVPGQMLHLP
jgi:nucleoid-associated protein YgaU